MPDPVDLTFFDDPDDLRRFFQVTVMAYAGALSSIEAGGLTLAEERDDQAVLLGRLVVKMLTYKADRATDLSAHGHAVVAEADAELAKVWPMFERFLESELADARKIIEKMKAERRGPLN